LDISESEIKEIFFEG